MLRYVLRRSLEVVPTVLLVLTLVFLALRVMPGDPAIAALGEFATPDAIASFRTKLGLDAPLWMQYLTFVRHAVVLDFGRSMSNDAPINGLLAQALPYTLSLAGAATLIGIVIGLPLGVVAALKRNTLADVASMAIALLGVAAPGFLLALVLIYTLSYHLGWFPVRGAGEGGDWLTQLHALALPALALGFNSAALTARTTRSALLGVLGRERLRAPGGEVLGGNLAPDGFEYRTTVQLEGGCAGGLDLRLRLAIEGGVGASLDGREAKWEGVLTDANADARRRASGGVSYLRAKR